MIGSAVFYVSLPVVTAAYFIGAIPFGYIIPRLFRDVDIRTMGSGNTGATNVARTLGWRFGLPVFALDLAKGLLPALFFPMLADQAFSIELTPEALLLAQVFCGASSIIGHMLPVYLRFKGGKGVATAAGVFIALAWLPTVIAFGTWLLAVAVTRYVSVGSILAASALPILYASLQKGAFDAGLPVFVFCCLVCVLVVVKHISNIKRLVQGNENKIKL